MKINKTKSAIIILLICYIFYLGYLLLSWADNEISFKYWIDYYPADTNLTDRIPWLIEIYLTIVYSSMFFTIISILILLYIIEKKIWNK